MTGKYPPGISVAAFERGDIDPERFDHEAHLYAAWLYLDAFSDEACERFVAALKRLTIKLGVPGMYHDTITRFYMALLAERRQQSPSSDWQAFREANRDLFDRSENVLARYYSAARLASKAARRSFVLPDKLPAIRTGSE